METFDLKHTVLLLVIGRHKYMNCSKGGNIGLTIFCIWYVLA